MVLRFFGFCLTLSVLEVLKNLIFEIPIIQKTEKSINLDIITKPNEYYLLNVRMKAIFTFTFFFLNHYLHKKKN